jgi:NAD(P)-dependent dehydrogenase (short-subunit alcohol dehydrogenase family)
MSRVAVVTGAASGIGEATKSLLESRGDRVIGADIQDAEIQCDLSTTDGRQVLVDGILARTGGAVDAVYAVAGASQPSPRTAAVNFFGMVATLEGLRPLLARSSAPRAVAVSSAAAIFPVDEQLMSAMLAGHETAAIRRAEQLTESPDNLGHLIYTSSKRAMSRWIRQQAASDEWAGAGIALNAIAPGTIATPMSAPFTTTPESTAALMRRFPMPLGGIAPPGAVAELLAFLGSERNTHLCGQIIYVDGGSDVVRRGDTVW